MENGGQRITVSDQENGFGYPNPEKPDGFVTIDMESFPNVIHKELSSNSRITMQRNISRKGYFRSNDRKIPFDAIENDNEPSTPRSPLRVGSGTPEKSVLGAAALGPAERTATSVAAPQLHQITVTTAGNISGETSENRFKTTMKKNSFKRSPATWFRDPKKVLLLFATLSSIGSILLIIFTLSLSKSNPEDASLD